MDNSIHEVQKDLKEALKSKLIPGWRISGGLIYNEDFSECCADIAVEKLPLSVRSSNALRRAHLHGVADILLISAEELANIRNLGSKSVDEILSVVHGYLSGQVSSDVSARETPDDKEVEKAENPTFEELPISMLSLSIRSANWLAKSGYRYIHEIADLPFEKIKEIKNLGLISAQEIYEKVRQFVNNYERQHPEEMALRGPAVEKAILDALKRHEIDGLTFDEIKAALPESLTAEMLSERLEALIEKKKIKYNDRYFISYPSFADILTEHIDDRSAQVVIMRTNGMTLEESAQALGGLTRERARQLEAKYMRSLFSRYGRLDEDKYGYFYQTYETTDELLNHYLGLSKETIYFLEYKYKGIGKKLPIDETALNDPKLPTPLKKPIEKYIQSLKIRIGNDYVYAKRHLVEDALYPIYCKDTITFTEFVKLFNTFVTENQKPELIITDELCRSRSNKCAASKLILWTLNQRMRYYDIEAIDKADFLDRLNLKQYHDIEISAKKILDENPELMEEYDIRNEYELHNLLKKLNVESAYPELVLGRNPIMQFGAANREKQVVDLLTQLTPISQYDFADAYSELYGVPAVTVMANYVPYIKHYINKDKILEMDVPSLSEYELNRLREVLTEDFYLIERLREIARREFPDMPQDKINHYTLHQLGFHAYSGYVIRSTYRGAQEYFTALLTKDDIIDTNPFPSEMIYIQSYYGVLTMLTADYELIEFMPKKYIRMSRLTALFGTTKDDLKAFCQRVSDYTDKQYFTIRSLKQEGFDDELFELGFDDCFYSSVLAADKEHFAHRKFGGNMIFRVGTQPFLFSDFVEWLVYREESLSIDLYELVDMLYDTYGIKFDRHDIKWKILPGTSMYYTDITEKIYADYEIYFDEI